MAATEHGLLVRERKARCSPPVGVVVRLRAVFAVLLAACIAAAPEQALGLEPQPLQNGWVERKDLRVDLFGMRRRGVS